MPLDVANAGHSEANAAHSQAPMRAHTHVVIGHVVVGLRQHILKRLHAFSSAYTPSQAPTRLNAHTPIPKPPILLYYCISVLILHKCPQTNDCQIRAKTTTAT